MVLVFVVNSIAWIMVITVKLAQEARVTPMLLLSSPIFPHASIPRYTYILLVKNIWKSYIWTADKDVNESDPRSNMHYLGSSEVSFLS